MRVSAAVIFATSFVALSTPALATGLIHSANTEIGYTTHPDHAQPEMARAEVLAEIGRAKTDGTWQYHRIGVPLPVKAGTPLTRAQVEAELLRAQKHPSWSARRVGAPAVMD